MRNDRIWLRCEACAKQWLRVPSGIEEACCKKCSGPLRVARPKSSGRLAAAGRIGGRKRAQMGGSGIALEGRVHAG